MTSASIRNSLTACWVDLVRAGIAIYGLNPVPQHEDLRPAMTFRSSVVLTKRIAGGESVSYGQTWTAVTDTTLALVPVGYADGVPRGLSGRMEVWLGGRRRPVAGRVCMDQIVLDCDDDPVAAGDVAVLFGPGDDGEPTVDDWAEVNRKVSRIVDALPNGPIGHPTIQVFLAGGVPEVMLHLRDAGLLHLELVGRRVDRDLFDLVGALGDLLLVVGIAASGLRGQVHELRGGLPGADGLEDVDV